jgi:hypothetical protein
MHLLRLKKPRGRFFNYPISVCTFGNGPLVLDSRLFLLNFSGFLHGGAVQEHSADWPVTLHGRFCDRVFQGEKLQNPHHGFNSHHRFRFDGF